MTEIIQIAGVAVWPHLTRPDTKWKEEGEYHTKLRIDADAAEPLIEQFTAMQEAEMRLAQKKAKGKKAKAADLPVQPEYDDDGEETGYYTVKASTKASGTSKKTGKTWMRKLPLFDGRGKPLPSKVSLYSGSELILAVEARAWTNPKAEVGVKLYLEAVQVIKLVNGSGVSAGKFGFGAVEGAEDLSDYATVSEHEEVATDETEAAEVATDDYDFD